MEAAILMPANTPKSVSMSLTIAIDAWLKSTARERGISVSELARDVFEKAMTESEQSTPERGVA